MKQITGGITAAKGFTVGSTAAGLKRKNKDLMVLISSHDATVAGSFTTNVVKAAPVVWDQQIVASGQKVKALVTNSGNANACTGTQGYADCQKMAELVGDHLQIAPTQVLVCSTGVIGVPLPMPIIEKGIAAALADCQSSVEAASEAAAAICTTDTFIKEVALEIELEGKTVRIGGMAKGSGMIHPNMATMLAFITTDAAVKQSYLQSLLKSTVVDSYNMISVDGDTSTNDTVLVLANGTSGTSVIDENHPQRSVFEEAFLFVHTALAKSIVKDGEGAGIFIEMHVKGAPSKEDARLMARSAISSSLVKTAFFGADANWGRLLCAMGYSGANFDPQSVSLAYISEAGMIVVLDKGVPVAFNEDLAKKILTQKVVQVEAVVGDGPGEATAWGCDLSYEYVRINGEYRS
ncbi:MAG: bifunctional ornithine acetyltransferase/N-acetylglutamate synthase [Sphaerochaetaceae bacterium]